MIRPEPYFVVSENVGTILSGAIQPVIPSIRVQTFFLKYLLFVCLCLLHYCIRGLPTLLQYPQ